MYIVHMKIKKREEIMHIVEEIIKNLFKKYTFVVCGVSCLVNQI